MRKNYQTSTHRARYAGRVTPKKAKLDHDQATHEAALALPDTVTVAIADLAGELEEGLLAFAVGTGLKVLDVVMGLRVSRQAEIEGLDLSQHGEEGYIFY